MSVDNQRQLRIFLCYAREDEHAVRHLYKQLQVEGFEPWMDKQDILPGQAWETEIPKAVKRSDVVLVCLTPGFVKKQGYGQKEINLALDTAEEQPEDAIFVIPLRLEACAVPERLSRWQWCNMFENGYHLLIKALLYRAEQLGIAVQPSESGLEPQPLPDTAHSTKSKSSQSNTRKPIWIGVVIAVAALLIGSVLIFNDSLFVAPQSHPEPTNTPTSHPEKDAKEYYDLGKDYDNQGDYKQAIENFDKAIQLNPEYTDAYIYRGIAYSNLGDNEKAIADYDQAIALDPQNAAVYLNRGNAYSNLGDNEKAIADYDQAIALDPQYALAYYNRGFAYYNLEEYEKAIADYDQAIALDYQYAFVYNSRGLVYRKLGEYEKAIVDCDQAIALDPQYTYAYHNRGFAYRKLGENQKAIGDLKIFVNLAEGQSSLDGLVSEAEKLLEELE